MQAATPWRRHYLRHLLKLKAPVLITTATIAAIEFGSPMMLGWLGAAALPWLINLWSRRRHIETSWAAVELLMAAVRERSRRLRLRELLLLVLRSTILLLAALAAARPAWRHTAAGAPPSHRTHHVIVIDQSASMAATDGGSSRFDRARGRARQIIEGAPAGDAFSVIGWSNSAENVLGRATFESAAALAAVDSLVAVDTVADLPLAARAASAAVKSAAQEFPGLTGARSVFISDLAVNTWSHALKKPGDGSDGGEPQGGDDAPADPWTELARASEIVVEPMDDGARQNLAVTNISASPASPVLDRPVTVAVTFKSFGIAAARDIAVELLLDDVRVAQQPASLPPGGEATVRFEARLLDAGNHVFEARLVDSQDSLGVDNRRWLSVEASAGPRVLCVSDVTSGVEDVARALNPRYRDGAVADGISVQIMPTAGLAAAELAAYDAVFACNLAALSPREQRLLERYVRGGGALVIILGDRTLPTPYNQLFARQAEDQQGTSRPLLPVELAEQPVAGDWRLDPRDYRHPILEPFAGRTRTGLLGVRVSQYYPVRILDDDRVPRVALAFTSGDPAIIIGEHGLGRIALVATDPALPTRTEPWSTLAVSPSFVPLVRELFRHASAERRHEQLNRLAGEPLTPPATAERAGGKELVWKSPAGKLTSTPPDSRHSGVYTLQHESDGTVLSTIAVNVDPAEGDLSAIDADDLPQRGQDTASSAGGLPASGAAPLHHYLLVVVAVLVLIELAASWLFGRGWA